MRQTLDFLLYDWLGTESLTARTRYATHSRETFDAVLDMSERLARERFGPFNRLVDVQEPRVSNGQVVLPQATHEAVRAYAESGLLAAGQDEGLGGMQLPYVVDMAANAFFSKASIALSAYAMLTYANANLLVAHGTDAQRRAFALPQIQGRFLGTMCLSEPHAGSSLGDITTRAVADGDGYDTDVLGPRFRLVGNKMWISGGEHEMGENIVHLVLAKIAGPQGNLPAGPKGISLFAVPRFLVDEQGRVSSERNDVALAGLNHKLGYRGTTNALLNFGEGRFPVRSPGGIGGTGRGAIGYLIGAPGAGLAQMFHMMNEARINVGMGATMLGLAGYEAALDYARNRPQGRLVGTGGKDPVTAPVAIIHHPDVKRMLLAQKAYCEGGLALGLYCARLVDDANTGPPEQQHANRQLLELLTPIAKSWPSEWCLEANSLAIQVLGGYGYTRDYPVEQYWRDNRLNMIHEGTHGIQALDLLGRKVAQDGRAALDALFGRCAATADAARQFPGLAAHGDTLLTAIQSLGAATSVALDTSAPALRTANATPYLQAFGHVVVGWLWLDVACASARAAALRKVAAHAGRQQACHYFYGYEMPRVQAWLQAVSRRDPTCLDMQDDWF